MYPVRGTLVPQARHARHGRDRRRHWRQARLSPERLARTPSLQSLDVAPLPLRGPALPLVAERRGDTQLVGQALARLLTLGILFVQRGRDGRRAAARREPAYRNVVLERPPAHAQPVTRLHRFRPLGAGAVQLDLAAVDGLSRQGPRLEEARGPKPSVEAHLRDVRHRSEELSFRTKPTSMRFTSITACSKRVCAGPSTKPRSAARSK